MDRETLAQIEQEMSIFVRRIILSEKRYYKLERSAYIILQQLATMGPSGVKRLADTLGLDVSTISRQAAALEKKGYAKKMPNPADGRSYYYQITNLGETELTDNRQLKLDRISSMLDGWSNEDCSRFGELLNKYNQSVSGKEK